MKINDRRTDEQKASTRYYVNATDKFMSGWGHASGGKSYFCIACSSPAQLGKAVRWLESRDEMKRVAESEQPRKARGSHTSIIHFEDTGAAD